MIQKLEFINGCYTSSAKKRPLSARIAPQTYFRLKLSMIVIAGGLKAKKNMYGDSEWIGSSLSTLDLLEKTGINISIKGADNFINLKGPCVFISNHMSTLETFVLPGVIQPYRDVAFIVKKSLLTYPVFGHIMRSRNPVVVSRENPRDDLKTVLTEGAQRLTKGISVIVFPQGTRSSRLDSSDFNTIGIKLAKNAGVPLVPVALKTDAWGNGKLIKEFGRMKPGANVYFEFGSPMRISGRGTEEHEAVVAFIRSRLSEWAD
ncbi:MAG: lysophospholipid acyltransferase family protein [Dissulfurispiraceae bacterium]|jgi:1-acyl-sn-glycerol-3-phosphate acyltransferase|nr:lysophospholipid acyltransferase family protein [Dissulfurispiraceae bacterium]